MSALLQHRTSTDRLHTRYQEYYATSELVDVRVDPAEIALVAGTPKAVVGGITVDRRDPRRVVVTAALDNLLKGAASQAVQNLNRAFALPITRGLQL